MVSMAAVFCTIPIQQADRNYHGIDLIYQSEQQKQHRAVQRAQIAQSFMQSSSLRSWTILEKQNWGKKWGKGRGEGGKQERQCLYMLVQAKTNVQIQN
ncbi:hypothetical protein CEXT_228651 [Caerostris extrusa]|uniref:Uncharacterized protein n=1 Tax=Caerostris extrusa TaxID=172846 RepID=A0AAV4MIF6_CAEEX|nr:hypothetical protein CEXT_228651 [Caerostris extrusa]